MDSKHQYVVDLREWELPRSDDLEDKLIDELVAKARVSYFNRERLGDELHSVFLDRLRELAQSVVNETIEYWLRGLADGNDGKCPASCFEFPYLERAENVEPLTVAYCVDNEDGSRCELLRTTLDRALRRCLEQDPPAPDMRHRAKVLAAQLRALAAQIDDGVVVLRRT